jgi:hypothetical protein
MAAVIEKTLRELERNRIVDKATGLLLFTYKDLLAMEQVGIIEEDERVELIGGQIYVMTIKPPHATAVSSFAHELSATFYGRANVISQNPLRVSEDMKDINLPQPDVMLVKEGFYLDHPKPKDVYLLIEISDSTYNKDKNEKLPLYAQSGVMEVWIANLPKRCIEVYLLAGNATYTLQGTYELTATLAPSAFPDVARQWLPKQIHEVLDKFPPQ